MSHPGPIPRVKICGVTREEDVERAVDLGTHLVGFVLVPGTPRGLTPRLARELARRLPASVGGVLVFRKTTVDVVRRVVAITGVRRVQLHRTSETVAGSLESEGLIVHRVVDANDSTTHLLPATPRRLYHLDTGGGGTGHPFDWQRLEPVAPPFVFIAGGITPENLPRLLESHPWGIDVSSGVESAPGIKDPKRLEALFSVLRESHTGKGKPTL